uniref:Uncharacterized protein n=1 Tax=Helianthus annuus TaxID=4232 RepID=A0A251SSC2_HELAN
MVIMMYLVPKEANDQPKELAIAEWDTGTDAGPLVTRPRHIRFESLHKEGRNYAWQHWVNGGRNRGN